MGLIGLRYEEGQTPLDEDEKEGLLIGTVTTREDLDEAEQRNIEDAVQWTYQRRAKFSAKEILTEKFMNDLHKRMFGSVWKWAGDFRRTNKNIGVDKYQIATGLQTLLDDCKYWMENETFSPEEIAIRFKHRIVAIHCYSNGNGRHSRLIGDIIIDKLFGMPVFTWGGNSLSRSNETRAQYLQALREADNGNYAPLILFAWS